MSLPHEENNNLPTVETTTADGSEGQFLAPPKIPRTTSTESSLVVPHIGDVDEATTMTMMMIPLKSDDDNQAAAAAESVEAMAVLQQQEEARAAATTTSPSLRGLKFADAEKLLEQVIPPEEPDATLLQKSEETKSNNEADSAGARTEEHVPAVLDVATAETILDRVIPKDPNELEQTGILNSVESVPGLHLGELSTGAQEQLKQDVCKGEVEIDSSRQPHETAAIDTVASDLTSDDSNLLLEEKFRSLSLQAQEIGKLKDKKSRTIQPDASKSAAAKKVTSLPRVAQLASKRVELQHTTGDDRVTSGRIHASLPRVAQLSPKKFETEVEAPGKAATVPRKHAVLPRVAQLPAKKVESAATEDGIQEKATPPRINAGLPRVARLPPKAATEKTSERVEVLPTETGKKLAGLPRVAKLQKSIQKDDNASSLSAELKGPPSIRLSGLPRVALLPHPKGVAEKFVSKPIAPMPMKVSSDPSSYHYLRHTVSSAAHVSSRVESPPKPGDLVTMQVPISGESSRLPLRTKRASPVATSPGAASKLTTTELKHNLSTGSEELADEHDLELDKLLSEDAEYVPQKALESDRIDTPGRSSNEKAVSPQEYASPDDVRTIDLHREHSSALDPKNLETAVDAANDAGAEQR